MPVHAGQVRHQPPRARSPQNAATDRPPVRWSERCRSSLRIRQIRRSTRLQFVLLRGGTELSRWRGSRSGAPPPSTRATPRHPPPPPPTPRNPPRRTPPTPPPPPPTP